MLTLAPTIRSYQPTDRANVIALLNRGSRHHKMLNWQQPAHWLEKSQTTVVVGSTDQGIAAVMGIESAGSADAWLRLIALGSGVSRHVTVRNLWAACQYDLQERGIERVHFLGSSDGYFAALHSKAWMPTEQLITFRLSLGSDINKGSHNPTVTICAANRADLRAVQATDHRAFDTIWQFDQAMFAAALERSLVFLIAEKDDDIVGYAIAMDTQTGGHLARIAVSPAVQGMGIGRQLVAAVVSHYQQSKSWLTLNTQASNIVSQQFYRQLGFQQDHFTVPVFTYAL